MQNQSITQAHQYLPAIRNAVQEWAAVTTDANSARYTDLVRDKVAALFGNTAGKALGFFMFSGVPLHLVNTSHIGHWRHHLEDMGLAPASVYARISRLSAFYAWLMKQDAFKSSITSNPVILARPKAPKAYQSKGTQSLSDENVKALLRVVQQDARTGDVAAIRDYALLRFYLATGKRREEIVALKWSDLTMNGIITITAKEKGGVYTSTEITDPGVKAALFTYLKATGRWDLENNTPAMQADSDLWLRHDRAAKGEQPVTSHGFVKALKQYAQRAGIGDIHLHQTRHTVARLVGEESGDMGDVQTVLGHADRRTTEVYLARIAIKKDKYSGAIANRLGLNKE